MIDGVEAMERVGDYFDAFLDDLSPARRKMVARKIGQRLRRLNTQRIAGNREPDGTAMAARRKRTAFRGEEDRSGKKMFRKLRLARNFEIRPSSDGVELRTKRGAAGIANTHHFGRVGYVGKTRDGRSIRTRYERRRLLGFGDEDLNELAEELLNWLDRASS